MSDKMLPTCLECGYSLEGLSVPRCPECGRRYDPDDLSTFGQDTGPLVRLYRAADASEAHVLAETLRQEGLRAAAITTGTEMGRADSELWVGGRSLERASELVRAYLERKALKPKYGREIADDEPERPCPGCASPVPAHFVVCWSCGRELDDG